MKSNKIVAALALALSLASLSAVADTTATSSSTSGAGAYSGSVAAPNQQIGITFEGSRQPSSVSVKSVPDVFPPALTASITECFGSRSGGASFLGIGASGGATYVDKDCNLRRKAATAISIGVPTVAFQIMCADPDFYKAASAAMVETQGYSCINGPEEN